MITYTMVADAASWITLGSLVAAAAANGARMKPPWAIEE